MITHVVSYKFSDSADAPEGAARLRSMQGQIPSLLSLHCGYDSLGRDGAYDVVLVTEHEDEAGLQAYGDHPVHKEVQGWLLEHMVGRTVVDSDNFN